LQVIETVEITGPIPAGYTQPVRTVGQNLADILESSGVSQVALADRLGQRQPSVWKVLNQKGLPKLGTLLKIAKAVPCRVEDLIVGVDEGYEQAIGRDLLRHAGTGQQTSHNQGESDVPASARKRIAELERRLAEADDLLDQVQALAGSLARVLAAREKERPATRAQSQTRRPNRKTG